MKNQLEEDIGEQIIAKLKILEVIIKNKFRKFEENDQEYSIALSCGNRSIQ